MKKSFNEDFEDAFMDGTIWLGHIGFFLYLIISLPIWGLPYLVKKIKESR